MQRIEQIMAAQHIPGLAIGIEQGGRRVHEGYYGLANLEHAVPVRPETIFEIASVTKLFTAQAILWLAQQGKLGVDDRLGDHIRADQVDLPVAWRAITIQQCLNHQSGLPNYTSPAAYWEQTRRDKTHAEVLALVRNEPLRFEPGARYAYDNTGYYLLGLVIEAVSGSAFADFLVRTIFAPLGMTRTRANDYDAIIPNRAQGYNSTDQGLINKPYYSTSNTFSAGVLLSTVNDLLTWCRALYTDAILDTDSRRAWWTLHPSREANEREFNHSVCLGWFQVDSELGPFLGHNGGISGFASALIHYREPGFGLAAPDSAPAEGPITAVVLCNSGRVEAPHLIGIEAIKALQTG